MEGVDTFFLVFDITLAVVAVLVVAISYFLFFHSVKRKKPNPNPKYLKNPNNPWTKMKPIMDEGKKWINSQNMEQIEIDSYDGLRLNGYYIASKEKTGKTMLLMHGYHSEDFNDFSQSARFFHEKGYNLLLADQRCHGKSQGEYICFGVKERFDCLKWIKYLDKTIENPEIFLMGVSMGCATVLMTLGFDLPKSVKGCIADCGFTSPKAIVKKVVTKDYHLPKFPFIYIMELMCKRFAGFSMGEYSTFDALNSNKLPVLFIHGGNDDFVPLWMTKENYIYCKAPKELLIIDDAPHAQSFLIDPKACKESMGNFLDKYA